MDTTSPDASGSDARGESAPGPAAPGPGPQDGGPRVTGAQVRDLRRLRRSTSDKTVAGVAGGLARHLDVDPVILRVGFVVLAFFGGAGLLLYLAGWLLLPTDDGRPATLRLDDRSRTVALTLALAVAALALVADLVDTSVGVFDIPWGLVLLAALVVWLVTRRSGDQPPQTPPYHQPPHPQSSHPQAGPQQPGTAYAVGTTGPATGPATGPVTSPAAEGVAYRPFQPPLPPRDPRKRGPLLFGPTLALLLLAWGVLGVVDVAGLDVPGSAYPALGVVVAAVVLLVGAFWGRAGGVIALGLLLAVATLVSGAVERIEAPSTLVAPLSAAELQDSYSEDVGQVEIDLTGLPATELAALDGRTLDLELGVGELVVVVPEGLAVDVTGTVNGAGEMQLLTFSREGFGGEDPMIARVYDPEGDGTAEQLPPARTTSMTEPEAPLLTIDASVELGRIEVTTR
ncbi:PspC domain-containing protein [Nocardioides bruguierae]|uniref:PspC domain-containing protein n=1 Tax=Nocardioides bruguierae TaxID=2945102 RepID=UPI002021E7FE|nr:PspC domain-containing protein [Nocardioides bruguierae]MCL8025170.1 PspC domain-containing protein [Nocardioides bruguierae]